MNVDELLDDSDTSDEDYLPSGKVDVPSEIDSDGDSEEPLSDLENPDAREKKRQKKSTKTKKRLKNDSQKSGNSKENDHEVEENPDKKKQVDDLWADFMKDTGFTPKDSRSNSKNLNKTKPKENNSSITQKIDLSTNETSQKLPKKVKITQVFEFAGEEVKVEKEVAVNSAEARLLDKAPDDEAPKSIKGKRSGGLSGISGVLSQLGKKPKISTLEKSKLDWDKFKKDENIEEELQTYNKGKDGYLERQDFLQRADLRRFEIEKDIRTVERNKRFNTTL